MMKSNEYSDMMSSIHAPKKLEDRVLRAVRRDEKKRKGAYSRGFSFVQKAAVAAVLLMALPVTVYAAIKYTSLSEHWSRYGTQEQAQAIETLTSTLPAPSKALENSNEYAQFRVAETAWDGNTLMVTAEIRPVSDQYFLVPSELDENCSVSELQLDGLTGDQTIAEYAKSLGKTPVMVSVGFYQGENHVDGGRSSQCFSDGVVRQYHTLNVAPGDAVKLNCVGIVSGPTIPDEVWLNDRVKFDVDVKNSSTYQNTNGHSFTVFDKSLPENLTIHSLTFQDTELGTYATFTYSFTLTEQDQAEIDKFFGGEVPLGGGYNFSLMDNDGNYLPLLRMASDSWEDNGDGTVSFTSGYERIENYDDLCFQLVSGDGEGGILKTGPYTIGK